MGKNNVFVKQSGFLKKKPYVMSCMLAFSVLMLIYTVLSLMGVVGTYSEVATLFLFVSVALSCFFMWLTDKLPIENDFIIALVDVADIVASVFLINILAYSLVFNEPFVTEPKDILAVFGVIVLDYASVCVIFRLQHLKDGKQINEKIKTMKSGGNIFEQDSRGK